MSIFLKSTGTCCTISHAETTSSFFNMFLFISAVNAFPISKGNISGATNSCPSVSLMILLFSGWFKVRLLLLFVKPNYLTAPYAAAPQENRIVAQGLWIVQRSNRAAQGKACINAKYPIAVGSIFARGGSSEAGITRVCRSQNRLRAPD